MAVNLSSFAGAGAQFFSNDGIPLSGGKIYSYAAGTTTPQATYTTSAGSIPNSNPIILDSAGRTPQEIWLTTGATYKFVLQDANSAVIGTYDNLPGLNDNSAVYADLANTTDNAKGDALVGFKQSNSSGFLSGAVARTVNTKLAEFVSVKDFGATGDGSTDDLLAIQNAINYISANNSNITYTQGGTVFFPPGKYRVTGTIYLTKGVRLLGTMAGASFAFDSGTANVNAASTIYADFATPNTIVIDSVGFITATGLRPSSTTNVNGSQIGSNTINPTHSPSIEHLRVTAMGTAANVITGVRMAGSPGFNINNVEVLCGRYGIVAQASWGASIRNVNVQAGNVGIALTNDINNIQIDEAYITVGSAAMTTPYFYYTGDAGIPYINPTANLTQTTGLYTLYANGVINAIITEGSNIGLNFRNSAFTLNTPYAEALTDYWTFCYSSRLIMTASVPGIGASLNLFYFAAGSIVDVSVSREVLPYFGEYVEFFDDTALCQVVIHQSPKSTNNYNTLKYVWSQENGQLLFLASPNLSANANMLDDYEEGAWTPTIGDSDGILWTMTTQNGSYTKVGRQIIAQFKIVTTSQGAVTAGQYAHLRGWPFGLAFTEGTSTGTNIAVKQASLTITGETGGLALLGSGTSANGVYMYQNGGTTPLINSDLGAAITIEGTMVAFQT